MPAVSGPGQARWYRLCKNPKMMEHRRMAAILILTVGILAVAAGLWFQLRRNESPGTAQAPAATPAATATSLPRPTVVAQAPTAVAMAIPTPVSRDVVLEMSESDLDAELGDRLVGQPLGTTPLGEAKIQSVAVQLRDRQVRLNGNALVGILRTPFALAGTV